MHSDKVYRHHLAIKLVIYYLVMIGTIAYISVFHPDIMNFLPFGGLGEPFGTFDSYSSLQDEIIATYRPINEFTGSIQLLMALTGTILVMIPIRWIYAGLSFGRYRQSIAANLILLPLIVTGIVSIVQNSLALAFSLAGIVAGVSYRTRLKDSADALYIFFSIGIGLAAGTQSMGIAIVMSLFFAFAVVVIPPQAEHEESLPAETPDNTKQTKADNANKDVQQ